MAMRIVIVVVIVALVIGGALLLLPREKPSEFDFPVWAFEAFETGFEEKDVGNIEFGDRVVKAGQPIVFFAKYGCRGDCGFFGEELPLGSYCNSSPCLEGGCVTAAFIDGKLVSSNDNHRGYDTSRGGMLWSVSVPSGKGGVHILDVKQACEYKNANSSGSSRFWGVPQSLACVSGFHGSGFLGQSCSVSNVSICDFPSTKDSDNFCSQFPVFEKDLVLDSSIISWQTVASASFYNDDDLCLIPSGYLLASEEFVGGDVVSIGSFRYPVESFCRWENMRITVVGARTDSLVTPYDALKRGESVVIPSGEAWKFHYVIKANNQLQLVCEKDVGGRWDSGLEKCVPLAGFADICSRGQFDKFRGICVTQPLSPCEFGFLSDGKCVYNPPQNFNCAEDYLLAEFDLETRRCIVPIGTEGLCPKGTVFVLERNVCEYEPRTICNPHYRATYNIGSQKCEFDPNKLGVCPKGLVLDFALRTCSFDSTQKCPSGYSWNKGIARCEHIPSDDEVCPFGYGFNFLTGKCESQPSYFRLCPEGFEYDGTICFEDVEISEEQIVLEPVLPIVTPTEPIGEDLVVSIPAVVEPVVVLPAPSPPPVAFSLNALELFVVQNFWWIIAIVIIIVVVVIGGWVLLHG